MRKYAPESVHRYVIHTFIRPRRWFVSTKAVQQQRRIACLAPPFAPQWRVPPSLRTTSCINVSHSLYGPHGSVGSMVECGDGLLCVRLDKQRALLLHKYPYAVSTYSLSTDRVGKASSARSGLCVRFPAHYCRPFIPLEKTGISDAPGGRFYVCWTRTRQKPNSASQVCRGEQHSSSG